MTSGAAVRTPPERTLQQRDPLAALVGRPVSYFAAVGVTGYAAVMTVVNRDEIDDLPLALVSVLLVALAGLALVMRSSPLRAPLTSSTLVLVVALGLAALIVGAASMWQSNAYLRDDWGGPAIGLLLLALSPYRPAKELASAGVFSAIVVAVLALAQADSFVSGLPTIVFVVVAVTPILAMSLGAAAFADALVRSLDRWSVRVHRAVSDMAAERGESIARSVQQQSVTVLNQEIVPFLAELLDGGVVTEPVRDRARSAATTLRSAMVAGADRTWLDAAVEQATLPGAGATACVRDPERLAHLMSLEQRTAVRALLVALYGNASFTPEGASLEITSIGDRCCVVLIAALTSGEYAVRSDLAPFFAVVRAVFGDLEVEHEQPNLTLRFSYEQRRG